MLHAFRRTLLRAGGVGMGGPAAVVLLLGQSNIVGYSEPYDAGIDTTSSRLTQWAASGPSEGARIYASDPLWHPDDGATATDIGPAMFYGKAYIGANATNVLFVPAGFGGTALYRSRWDTPVGDLYVQAVALCNAALDAYPGSTLVQILWAQGESDIAVAGASYQASLYALIGALRAGIRDAEDVPFTIIGMVPEWIAGDGGAGAVTIDAVHAATPAAIGYSAFVTGASGSGNVVHFNAATARTNGTAAHTALATALANTVTAPDAPTGLTAGATTTTRISLSWTAPAAGPTPTHYAIQYRPAGGTVWTLSDRTISTAVSGQAIGLSPSTSYDMRVAAVAAGVVGAWTAVSTASTAAGTIGTSAVWSTTDKTNIIDVNAGWHDSATATIVGGGWRSLRSSTSQTAGVFYVEATVTQVSGANYVLGVGNASAALGTYAGADANSAGINGAGLFLPGGADSGIGAATTGDIIGMVVDLTANTIKFNRNNGAFSATLSISGVTGAKFVMGSFTVPTTGGEDLTLNQTLAYAPPVGATGWAP